MPITRRRTRRLLPVAAVSALSLTAVVMTPAAAVEVIPTASVEVTHTIAQVQGTGDATPLAGQTVTVQGVVTADHTTGGYRGLYVQTEGSGGPYGGTPGASDGIFVFLGNVTTTAAIGDLVRVTGVAGEYFGLTQINASGQAAVVEVLGEPDALPTPVSLPPTVLGDEREQYESMLVQPEGDYLVASTHEVDRFGALWLSAGDTLPVKSTEQVVAGPEADAIAAQNAARRLLLDDGRSSQVTTATQPYLSADRVVRNGDAVDFGDLTYVLHYGFDRWRLQPLTPIDASTPEDQKAGFEQRNPRPAAPDEVGGDLVVAAFNVLNYFTTFTEADPDARGARNQAQFDLQKAKIVAAITGLGADVVALQEIENSIHFGDGTPDVALADLVEGLNAAAGGPEWAYVPTPEVLVGQDAPDTDVIMNAIIYRPEALSPVGQSEAPVDEEVWDIAREPIGQVFTPADGAGAPFAVVANHFKSKGGDGPEPPDGQGRFNTERVGQATAVVEFVAELQQAAGTQDVVVLGDLNSYSQEDPIRTFAAAGFVDLVTTHAPGQYTYTFDGELGSLDHALATPSFAARVTGADVWEINSPEWFAFQYYGGLPQVEAGTVYRSSDHDPVLLGLTAAGSGDGGDGTVEIDLLGINDFHGRLEASGTTAGAAVLAGAVNAFRSANPHTLFVSAGDNIGASTFTSFVQDDTPTIDALNAMGLDVSALGNHEFDRGRVDLDDRVIPAADFPHLAANVYDRATGEAAFDEYWLTEVDGVTVGFIGAVTEDLPTLVTPAGIESLEIRSVVEEVNRVADQLSDGDQANGEADVLVLLVHEGPVTGEVQDATDDSAFGRIATEVSADVDAIFAGHTHQTHAHQLPVEGWTEGLTRPVVQGAQYGEALARVTLTVDTAEGEVVASSSEIVPLAPGGVAAFPADPEVAQIVADAVAVADELGRVSLGEITEDLTRARQTNGSENRGGESTLGNLVADVQLWATQDAGTQIAFMNPGGLRADLTYASTGPDDPDGNVTFREAANVQPFANTLVTTTLTGQQVVDVLEEQWQPDGSSRPFLKLGVSQSLTYTYDPTAPRGERVTQVLLEDEPIDPTAGYVVVVNSFLASGGDNFATLAQGADARDSGRVDLQAFVDYFAELSPIAPDPAQRAVGVQVVDPPTGGYAPGQEATVLLSSLLFSGGPDDATEVAVTVGGEPAGTFPIDPAIVDSTDEVGRATVVVTVPQGATGTALEVVATVPATGTTVTVPLPLAEQQVGPACTVEYRALGLRRGPFLGLVRVTNETDAPLTGWELQWDFTRGEQVRRGLVADVTQVGTTVTAKASPLNRTIRPGRSVVFGFQGTAVSWPGQPVGFTLDGAACEVS
ncbi:ExeM/NucH family extracellular endonuclease [Actinotalea sp. K2]|uniref:ExeM/NucH family extracellular endonuclease n=1 Tax=Actinotalea sp. K2 TaxID=2939438 RepID=UPI0020173F12|nr:ExeM/NucH family extracellular endonuclease [Actinotalea sp. K2]MCL3863117.1 ExeM/NucH family extracellular endonuclease [Actinotalea sp. K2]